MAFKLRTVTQDDVDSLVDIYFDAFSQDIFSCQIFPPSAQSSKEYWKKSFSEELDESNAIFFILTDSNPDNAKDIGFVKWVSPDAPWHDFDEDGYPEEGYPKIASKFYEMLFAGHKRLMQHTRHWYLDMMGVRKEYMGRGAATQMVNWGLDKAKKDGVVAFVESTGQSKTFYEKFGFQTIDNMAVDTPQGKAEVFFMTKQS